MLFHYLCKTCVVSGSPYTYSQLRAEKAKKLNNTRTEIVKGPPQEPQLNHGQPEVQQIISTSDSNAKCTLHKKRKKSNDELSLVISVKRSKLAPLQIEPGRLKLKKKKKRPHSPKSYKISIPRTLLNHDMKTSSSILQSSSNMLQDSIVPANDTVDEPVKKVKKHKGRKDKKLLLPVQGLYIHLT